jgi:hypothetical protein
MRHGALTSPTDLSASPVQSGPLPCLRLSEPHCAGWAARFRVDSVDLVSLPSTGFFLSIVFLTRPIVTTQVFGRALREDNQAGRGGAGEILGKLSRPCLWATYWRS